jgi:hypothetical protein
MPGARPASNLYKAGSILGKDVLTQCLITANGGCHHEMWKTRKANIARHDENQLMGRELGENYDHLSIWEYDLLMSPRVPVPENGMERSFEGKPTVFSSMNGLKKPKNVPNLTNRKMAQYYRVVGVACTARHFGPNTNFKGGVSFYIQGSLSIFNRSNQEFAFYDLIRAVLPNVDTTIRKREQALLPWNERHHQDRLEPILERFDPAEAFYLQAEPITQSFAGENKNMRDLRTLIDPDVAAIQDEDVLIPLTGRLYVLWIAYCAITGWSDMYGGTIAAPNSESLASFKASYNAYQAAEQIAPNKLATSQVTINGGVVTIKPSEELTERDNSKRLLDRMFVASKLGLFYDDHQHQNGASLKRNDNLVEGIVARSMRSFIMDPKISEAARISKTFGPGLRPATNVSGHSALNTVLNASSFVGQLEYIQGLAGKSFVQVSDRCRETLYDSVIARCIKNSSPGSPLDIVLQT